ncbi:MAG: 30S ribosomal protein S15 [Gammaproteobacteria bacterium]
MSLTSADKLPIINDAKRSENDSGSVEVQVSLITHRIKHLTEHFKLHKKDFHSRYGLQTMVNNRRKLLQYLKRKQLPRYRELIKKLGLRDS